MLVLMALSYVGVGVLGAYIAVRKGYSPTWAILTALICCAPVGLLIAVVVPTTSEGREQQRLKRKTLKELRDCSRVRNCPQCGRENSVNTRICPRCDYRIADTSSGDRRSG